MSHVPAAYQHLTLPEAVHRYLIDSLLTNFGFISKKFNQDKQNVREEGGSSAAANVHAGPLSD